MPKVKVNERAVKKAKSLIEARQYVLESGWSEANPGSEETSEFIAKHGWDAYGEWHLGVDDEAGEETKERYKFPYGDFRRVHRSGLVAAKQRAARSDYDAVEEAAGELLTTLDHARAG